MPAERRAPPTPIGWLRRARGNLARAKADRHLPEFFYEDLCFDAQQAAEKAIKGLLVHRRVEFPKTHAIMDLLSLLEANGIAVPGEIRQAGALTRYAVHTRYPGVGEEVTEEEYLRAVDLAECAVRWAESLIEAEKKES